MLLEGHRLEHNRYFLQADLFVGLLVEDQCIRRVQRSVAPKSRFRYYLNAPLEIFKIADLTDHVNHTRKASYIQNYCQTILVVFEILFDWVYFLLPCRVSSLSVQKQQHVFAVQTMVTTKTMEPSARVQVWVTENNLQDSIAAQPLPKLHHSWVVSQ